MFSRSAAAVIVLAAICGCESTPFDTNPPTFRSLTSTIPAVNAAVANCSRNYTVALGDTCDGISAKENVST